MFYTSYDKIYIFSLDLDKWRVPAVSAEMGSACPGPIWNHTACAFESKMIVFGGFNGSVQSSDVSILSFSDDGGESYVMVFLKLRFLRSVICVLTIFPDSCRWSQPTYPLGAKPSPLSQHTSCLHLGRYMVVFGGYNTSNGHLNELWIFDLHALSWTSPEYFGTPPSKRRGHGAAIIRDKMYIFGGFDGTSHLNDLHCIDLHSFSWVLLDSKGGRSPRRHHAMEAVGDFLVVYGGFDGERYLEDVYSLNVNTSVWTCWHILRPTMSPLNNIGGNGTIFGRSLHTMTFAKRRLVVFGGVHGSRSLQDVLYLENVAGK